MRAPIFSIITVTRNAARVLEQTILSVLNQTNSNIEFVIIDGASEDGTVDIIKRYQSGINYWISEPDKGIYDAMNKGLEAATGDYVWFLNAGDVLKHNEIVAELTEISKYYTHPDIIYGETDLMDQNGHVFAERRLKAPEKLTWKSFRMGMLVCHQAFIAKRLVMPTFNVLYRFSADFEWCIRCMKRADMIVNSRLRLVNYLYTGLTTANRKQSLKERYAIMCEYYGKFAASIAHGWFVCRYLWAKLTNKTL